MTAVIEPIRSKQASQGHGRSSPRRQGGEAERLPPRQIVAHDAKAPRLHAEPDALPDANGEIEQAQLAALIPGELLEPSEIIVLLIKPSPWYILLASLHSLAIVAMLTVALLFVSEWQAGGLTRQDAVLLGTGLAGVRLFWQFLEWLSRVYVLTDRRVICLQGVFRLQIWETPLTPIRHTATIRCIRERLFGLGTLGFAINDPDRFDAAWEMIAQPNEVHQIVAETLKRYR